MKFWNDILIQLGIIKRKCNLLFVGLDNSGKTTILNEMKLSPNVETIPTIGFSVEKFTRGKLSFTVFDMSGQGKYRDLWEHYLSDSDGIVFVIDSSDKLRISVARDELEAMLLNKNLRTRPIPILFLANKMDVAEGMAASDISNALELESIKDRNWNICSSNALTGEGIQLGLDWLTDQIENKL